MYISYDKLWKLLLEKEVSKSELHELTGLSTRTIAKLAKSETVTTDSLLRICEALDCGIDDIMEVTDGEKQMTLFDSFKKNAVQIGEDDAVNTYRVEKDGTVYVIKKTKKTAGSHTSIYCGEGLVVWNQFCQVGRLGGTTEKTVLARQKICSDGEVGIVVITGNPGAWRGLDDNGFCSVRGKRNPGDLLVMTYAEFKKYAV